MAPKRSAPQQRCTPSASLEASRAFVRDKLQQLVGEEVLGTNLEICVYNWSIQRAIDDGIARFWDNLAYRRLYLNKYRSLAFNLRDPRNPSLIERLKARQLKCTRVVSMTAQDLFPEQWAPILTKLRMRELLSTLDMAAAVPEGMLQCRKCKSRKVVWHMLQTRSADEPATVFCGCMECGSRWRQT